MAEARPATLGETRSALQRERRARQQALEREQREIIESIMCAPELAAVLDLADDGAATLPGHSF